MKSVATKQSAPAIDTDAISRVLMHGDLSRLTEEQKLSYYKNLCESVGLNSMTNPFTYMRLNGKEVLYAGKGCTEQLRGLHKVSVAITSAEFANDLYVVRVKGRLPDGREDESTGAVNVKGLSGEALANACMKAETKAKRRVTLSLIGLGMLDESEVETIPQAERSVEPQAAPRIVSPSAAPGDFVINFTKGFKGKKIKEMDVVELEKLYNWCIEKKAMPDFVVNAEAYLNEVSPPKLPDDDIPFFNDFEGSDGNSK